MGNRQQKSFGNTNQLETSTKGKVWDNNNFIEKDGRQYFINGKNKIIFKEYFSKNRTAIELLENAIRFEGKQS